MVLDTYLNKNGAQKKGRKHKRFSGKKKAHRGAMSFSVYFLIQSKKDGKIAIYVTQKRATMGLARKKSGRKTGSIVGNIRSFPAGAHFRFGFKAFPLEALD